MTDLSIDEREDAEATDDEDVDHLEEVPDGAGCVEIWEKISESRADDD